MNKKAVELSFGWLFAIMVGAIVILFAIFFASNLIKAGHNFSDSAAANQFDILLYPAGTGVEEGKLTLISFPSEAELNFKCKSSSFFGEQTLSLKTSTTLKNSGSNANNIQIVSHDKYIFSDSKINSKDFFVLSKPIYLPYKVADVLLIFPTSKSWCFVSPISSIEDEIQIYQRENLLFNKSVKIVDDKKDCNLRDTTVCFDFSDKKDCKINVNPQIGSVLIQDKGTVYFDLNDDKNVLLWAAIMSEPAYFECNLKRIIQRDLALARIYKDKQSIQGGSSCNPSLEGSFDSLISSLSSFNNSKSINDLSSISNEIRRQNSYDLCPAF